MTTERNRIVALLTHPLQASVAGFIVLFVVAEGAVRFLSGFVLLVSAGEGVVLVWIVAVLVTLPMAIVFVEYSSVVFIASAMGERKVRVVDVTDLLPFSTPLTSRLLYLALLLVAIVTPLGYHARPAVLVACGVAAVFVLPGVLAILALNGSLPMALSPRHFYTLVREMGPRYLLMPLISGAVLVAVVLLARHSMPWLPRSLAIGYLYCLAVHLLGRVVYSSRDRIGLAVTTAPELEEGKQEKILGKRHATMLEHAYQNSKSSVDDALHVIDEYLVGDLDTLGAREWVFSRLVDWADKATAVWFAHDLVARQLRQGQADNAVKTTAWCLRHNPGFRPKGADETFELANVAFRNGRNLIGTALLSDFGDRFPDSPHVVSSLLLCAKVALEKTNQRQLAQQLIARLEDSGRHGNDPRVAALRELAGGN